MGIARISGWVGALFLQKNPPAENTHPVNSSPHQARDRYVAPRASVRSGRDRKHPATGSCAPPSEGPRGRPVLKVVPGGASNQGRMTRWFKGIQKALNQYLSSQKGLARPIRPEFPHRELTPRSDIPDWDLSNEEYADLLAQAQGNDLASFMLKSALEFLDRDLEVASNVSIDYINFIESFFGPLISDIDLFQRVLPHTSLDDLVNLYQKVAEVGGFNRPAFEALLDRLKNQGSISIDDIKKAFDIQSGSMPRSRLPEGETAQKLPGRTLNPELRLMTGTVSPARRIRPEETMAAPTPRQIRPPTTLEFPATPPSLPTQYVTPAKSPSDESSHIFFEHPELTIPLLPLATPQTYAVAGGIASAAYEGLLAFGTGLVAFNPITLAASGFAIGIYLGVSEDEAQALAPQEQICR